MKEINYAKQESRAKLIVLCGPSHAGKTTFARQLSKNFTIISTDDIRKRLGCSFDGSRYETRVWDVFEAMKCRALEEGRNVILDACHISRQARWHSLQGPNDNHRKICVVFDLPIQSIRERCLKGNRMFLKEVERMWRAFQNSKPTSEELKRQGFDEVYFVKEYPGATFTHCLSENFTFRGDETVTTMDLPKVSSFFFAAGEAVARYVACVFAPTDIVEARRLPSGKRSWWRASQLADAALSLYYENRRGQNIHIGVNARRHRGDSKSNGVSCARCIFADFDETDVETAQQRWIQAGLPPPTLTLASGHGIHAYWRLKEPMQDLKAWSWVQKQLIRLLKSDPAIHDPARLMRLPGFTNHKNPKANCRIIEADPLRRYDWVLLRKKLFSPVNPIAKKRLVLKKNRHPYRMDMTHDSKNIIAIADKITARWKGAGKGQRNNRAFCYAAYLVRDLALPRDKALFFLQQWNQRNQPPLPMWELQQAIQNASIYGKHPVG